MVKLFSFRLADPGSSSSFVFLYFAKKFYIARDLNLGAQGQMLAYNLYPLLEQYTYLFQMSKYTG